MKTYFPKKEQTKYKIIIELESEYDFNSMKKSIVSYLSRSKNEWNRYKIEKIDKFTD